MEGRKKKASKRHARALGKARRETRDSDAARAAIDAAYEPARAKKARHAFATGPNADPQWLPPIAPELLGTQPFFAPEESRLPAPSTAFAYAASSSLNFSPFALSSYPQNLESSVESGASVSHHAQGELEVTSTAPEHVTDASSDMEISDDDGNKTIGLEVQASACNSPSYNGYPLSRCRDCAEKERDEASESAQVRVACEVLEPSVADELCRFRGLRILDLRKGAARLTTSFPRTTQDAWSFSDFPSTWNCALRTSHVETVKVTVVMPSRASSPMLNPFSE
jgi:hypothetical protein